MTDNQILRNLKIQSYKEKKTNYRRKEGEKVKDILGMLTTIIKL